MKKAKVVSSESSQAPPKQRNRKSAESPEWTVLKSGAMKHKDGVWYASPYAPGWFFYNNTFNDSIGPYKSFEDGLKEVQKKL